MHLANIVALFICVWFCLYLGVYYYFVVLGSDFDTEQVDKNSGNAIIESMHNEQKIVSSEDTQGVKPLANADYFDQFTNPFLSPSCSESFKAKVEANTRANSCTVVLGYVRNGKKSLFRTLESILKHSGHMLFKVVVVDDFGSEHMDLWPEWKDPKYSRVKVLRTPQKFGTAKAKNYAVKSLSNNQDIVVFLDSNSIVSANWLMPLTVTLDENPSSIVYPSIDIIDSADGGFIKSDNVVGGFSWSLQFRWDRASSQYAEDDLIISPASPGIFAMKTTAFLEMGLFDEMLSLNSDSGLALNAPEMVELSLRVWLCGGTIIRQPCSRAAYSYSNLRQNVPMGNGISEGVIDNHIMSIADHWWLASKQKGDAYRDTIYHSRFLNRVPHPLSLTPDARQPKQFHKVKSIGEGTCQSIDWYIKEVYPQLLDEIPAVESRYTKYTSTSYLKDNLQTELDQYSAKSEIQADVKEVERLKRIAEEGLRAQQGALTQLTPQQKQTRAKESHETHAEEVKNSLLCEDQPATYDGDRCADLAKAQGCDTVYMLFGCPKTCNFCDAEGMFCSDMYLKKCPLWKEEGQCESNKETMEVNCRRSCGYCRRKNDPVLNTPPVKTLVVAPLEDTSTAADAYVAQRQYAAGALPDPTVGNPCDLRGRPHGQLLQHIMLQPPQKIDPPIRLFCGIYTMKSKHSTNVKATKENWAKRCTGFMAFSTEEDLNIPAMKIEHEGEEKYDNMWQKSRSIWKYVAAHYANDFDYFLLGGDDMYFIIENLVAYLGSAEIKSAQSDGNGLYLGRRFFPPKQKVFNSGGAGYILDVKALLTLKDNIDTPKCFPHQVGFWEDVNVANCLRASSNHIEAYDTRDANGAERFHPFTPGQHLTYGMKNGKPNLNPDDWYVKYNPELKLGLECCSSESLSFHYVPYDLMPRLHSYMYHCSSK